jgi:formiminoglutamase
VPHAGLRVPEEAKPYCILSPHDIAADSDGGAAEIYDLSHLVSAYQTTDIARAIVDLNRAEGDRRADGVVKTHTCWNVPVYDPFPPEQVVESLIERYHRPYHSRLADAASKSGVLLGVDCHTMAEEGPPVGPDPGAKRPLVCLSDGDGTCPREWVEEMSRCFREALDQIVDMRRTPRPESGSIDAERLCVSVNTPFKGGHIIRSHARELPWMQLELSRAPFPDDEGKQALVTLALERFCRRILSPT